MAQGRHAHDISALVYQKPMNLLSLGSSGVGQQWQLFKGCRAPSEFQKGVQGIFSRKILLFGMKSSRGEWIANDKDEWQNLTEPTGKYWPCRNKFL